MSLTEFLLPTIMCIGFAKFIVNLLLLQKPLEMDGSHIPAMDILGPGRDSFAASMLLVFLLRTRSNSRYHRRIDRSIDGSSSSMSSSVLFNDP